MEAREKVSITVTVDDYIVNGNILCFGLIDGGNT